MGSPTPTGVIPVAVASSDTPVLLAIARLEGKVDATLAVHGNDLKSLISGHDDHEARIRVQEARDTVSPRDLWVGLTGAVAVAAALASLFRIIFPS